MVELDTNVLRGQNITLVGGATRSREYLWTAGNYEQAYRGLNPEQAAVLNQAMERKLGSQLATSQGREAIQYVGRPEVPLSGLSQEARAVDALARRQEIYEAQQAGLPVPAPKQVIQDREQRLLAEKQKQLELARQIQITGVAKTISQGQGPKAISPPTPKSDLTPVNKFGLPIEPMPSKRVVVQKAMPAGQQSGVLDVAYDDFLKGQGIRIEKSDKKLAEAGVGTLGYYRSAEKEIVIPENYLGGTLVSHEAGHVIFGTMDKNQTILEQMLKKTKEDKALQEKFSKYPLYYPSDLQQNEAFAVSSEEYYADRSGFKESVPIIGGAMDRALGVSDQNFLFGSEEMLDLNFEGLKVPSGGTVDSDVKGYSIPELVFISRKETLADYARIESRPLVGKDLVSGIETSKSVQPKLFGKEFRGLTDFETGKVTARFEPGVKETKTFFPTYQEIGSAISGRSDLSIGASYEAAGFVGGVGAGLLETPKNLELFVRGGVANPLETVRSTVSPSTYIGLGYKLAGGEGGFGSGKAFGELAGQIALTKGIAKGTGLAISNVPKIGEAVMFGAKKAPVALKQGYLNLGTELQKVSFELGEAKPKILQGAAESLGLQGEFGGIVYGKAVAKPRIYETMKYNLLEGTEPMPKNLLDITRLDYKKTLELPEPKFERFKPTKDTGLDYFLQKEQTAGLLKGLELERQGISLQKKAEPLGRKPLSDIVLELKKESRQNVDLFYLKTKPTQVYGPLLDTSKQRIISGTNLALDISRKTSPKMRLKVLKASPMEQLQLDFLKENLLKEMKPKPKAGLPKEVEYNIEMQLKPLAELFGGKEKIPKSTIDILTSKELGKYERLGISKKKMDLAEFFEYKTKGFGGIVPKKVSARQNIISGWERSLIEPVKPLPKTRPSLGILEQSKQEFGKIKAGTVTIQKQKILEGAKEAGLIPKPKPKYSVEEYLLHKGLYEEMQPKLIVSIAKKEVVSKPNTILDLKITEPKTLADLKVEQRLAQIKSKVKSEVALESRLSEIGMDYKTYASLVPSQAKQKVLVGKKPEVLSKNLWQKEQTAGLLKGLEFEKQKPIIYPKQVVPKQQGGATITILKEPTKLKESVSKQQSGLTVAILKEKEASVSQAKQKEKTTLNLGAGLALGLYGIPGMKTATVQSFAKQDSGIMAFSKAIQEQKSKQAEKIGSITISVPQQKIGEMSAYKTAFGAITSQMQGFASMQEAAQSQAKYSAATKLTTKTSTKRKYVEDYLDKFGKDSAKGFDVFVRKGKGSKEFIKISNAPLVYESALALGAIKTESAKRSFKILPTAGKGKRLFGLNQAKFAERFRPAKREAGVFVEKTKYAIDSPAELAQITFKGLEAKKARGKNKGKWFGRFF